MVVFRAVDAVAFITAAKMGHKPVGVIVVLKEPLFVEPTIFELPLKLRRRKELEYITQFNWNTTTNVTTM